MFFFRSRKQNKSRQTIDVRRTKFEEFRFANRFDFFAKFGSKTIDSNFFAENKNFSCPFRSQFSPNFSFDSQIDAFLVRRTNDLKIFSLFRRTFFVQLLRVRTVLFVQVQTRNWTRFSSLRRSTTFVQRSNRRVHRSIWETVVEKMTVAHYQTLTIRLTFLQRFVPKNQSIKQNFHFSRKNSSRTIESNQKNIVSTQFFAQRRRTSFSSLISEENR